VIGGLGMTGASFGTVTRAVKDGIELLGLGFELCVKGAGAVCGNTTDGYGPGPAKSWRTRLSKSRSVVGSTFNCHSK
jgi:hypothetical protein